MKDDDKLLATIRSQLFSAVIGDVMDAGGLQRQFLPPTIRAIDHDLVVAGHAMPVLEADCFGEYVVAERQARPFGLMFQALDSLRKDEIYIATGASPRYALWGGLMSTRAQSVGAAGAVLDGFHRDTREIRKLGFPVFSAGAYAQDQRVRGRVIDFRCAIEFANGVCVRPGDIIVGDIDGVCVIPAVHAEDVVAQALAKAKGEETVRNKIEAGRSTQDIFDETGIM
jgi:4-hydroxy-4-methyl-2-oxoglutarate aldolase